jgi:hypothetical protein
MLKIEYCLYTNIDRMFNCINKLDAPRRFSDRIINESILVQSKIDPYCINYGRFIIAENSYYSCLMPYHAKQVADIIETYFGDKSNINNIMDATANIGCDTINFRTRFDANCISLEVDLLVYNCLAQNQKNFTAETVIDSTKIPDENFSVHCNCLEFIKGFKKKMDFVYFDPPWGGADYWMKKDMMLFLEYDGESIPIYTVVRSVLEEGFTKTVIVKIPFNFNLSLFICQMADITYEYHVVMKPKKKRKYNERIAFSILICSIE